MNRNIRLDIAHFFGVFENRTERLLASLPEDTRRELGEELELLKASIERRLEEESVS